MSQVQNSTDQSAAYLQAEEFRAYIEKEVLLIIKDFVNQGTIEKERVQGMAREVLTLMQPGLSIDQLYANAVRIDDNYPELGPVVIKLMKAYEEKFNKQAVTEVSSLIKDGKYDDAQNMVMKVLMFKGM